MRNFILLSILFIFLDITGSWIPIYWMNPDRASVSITINAVFQAIGFRLFFAFWYWIVAYSVWFLVNWCILLLFPRSILRSVAVSSLVPILVIFMVPEAIPVVIWYVLLSTAFGLMFQKYVDTNHFENS